MSKLTILGEYGVPDDYGNESPSEGTEWPAYIAFDLRCNDAKQVTVYAGGEGFDHARKRAEAWAHSTIGGEWTMNDRRSA